MGRPNMTTLKRLFALSGRTCAFPGCEQSNFDADGNQLAEVAHICGDARSGPRYDPAQTDAERQGFGNLIVLCRTHHGQVDAAPEAYPVEFLRAIKAAHETAAKVGPTDVSARGDQLSGLLTVAGNIGSTIVNSPNAISGQTVTVRTSAQTAKIQPPADSIGADHLASRYISYLIERYNKFASMEPSRSRKFNYGAISKNVENNFSGPWRLQPLSSFDAICVYLHGRIDKTRQAKTNARKGYSAYRLFDDFSSEL